MSLIKSEINFKKYIEKQLLTKEFPVHQKEKEQLKSVIQESVQYGTSNTALILTLPGQGSSYLVNSVLSEFGDTITCILLSGLLHSNDHLALKNIIQQLHMEDLEEDKVTGSFFDNLNFVLESFKSSNRNEVKPLVIVLDQFEHFTFHKNQTLLYNLFDIVQSQQSAICIIAITKRIDALELLEKRVKSRFSPNEIYLMESCCLDLSMLQVSLKTRYADEWNASIKQLSANKKVQAILQIVETESKSIRLYKQFLLVLVSKISSEHKFLEEEDFREALNLFLPDEKLEILLNISLLELCLVIACNHHSEIYDKDPFNFEIIYKRFTQFCLQATSMSSITKNVVMRAFQRLESLGIIKCISSRSQREVQFYNLLYLSNDIQNAVKSYPNINTEVIQWATSNAVC